LRKRRRAEASKEQKDVAKSLQTGTYLRRQTALCEQLKVVDPQYDELTHKIIGCAMKVHTALGPGLLESAYAACLEYELKKAGLTVHREVPFKICYDEQILEVGYRLDMVVESRVVVENKSVETVLPIYKAQLISYLKLAGYPVGLLINFNVVHLRDGIHRLYPPR
jgi:GxxExxY protein